MMFRGEREKLDRGWERFPLKTKTFPSQLFLQDDHRAEDHIL